MAVIMTTLKPIPGSVLIQHLMESSLNQSEKTVMISEINSMGEYSIGKDPNSFRVRGYSRKCQIKQYLSSRDERFVNAMCNNNSICPYKNCGYKDTKKRSKCEVITFFKDLSDNRKPTPAPHNTSDTVHAKRVIPGEILNAKLKNQLFVYQRECRQPQCNHIHIVPNLNHMLRYVTKEDLVYIASCHNLFPPQIAFKHIHKSAILQQFLQHQCTKYCERALHFIEVFNDM